jgi:hypothetical protein
MDTILVGKGHIFRPISHVPGLQDALEPFHAVCGTELGISFTCSPYRSPDQVTCPTCYKYAPQVAQQPEKQPIQPKPKPLPAGQQTSLF